MFKSFAEERKLIWVVGLGLAVRLAAFPFLHASGYTSDEREYVYLAQEISAGGSFIDTNGEKSTRSPLFPFVLAGVFHLFGVNLVLATVLNCLSGALVVYLVYRLALDSFHDRTGALIASSAAAVYPGLVISSGLLQTESLYCVFFVLAFVYSLKVVDGGGVKEGVVLGVVSGLAALTRAVYIAFFPVLLCSLTVSRPERAVTKSIAGAIVAFFLILTPWTVRNYVEHGTLVPVSSWGGNSFLIGNNPFATGTWSVKKGFDDWYAMTAGKHGVQDVYALTEVERSALSGRLAWEYIVTHPVDALRLCAKKAHIFWIYPATHSDSNTRLQAVACMSDIFLWVGVCLGIVLTWASRHRLLSVFAALITFSLVHVAMHAEARYRVPLTPLMAVFFGAGGAMAVDNDRRKAFFSVKRNRAVTGIMLAFFGIVYLYTALLYLSGSL